MFGWILGFLFGRSAKIFDTKGNVLHDLPKERWEAWKNRYTGDPEYNWRNHTGTKAKDWRPPNTQA